MSDSEGQSVEIFRTGGVRWVVLVVAFTVGASLLIAASALVIFFITERGGWLVASDRIRSFLALIVFGALIAVTTYLLAAVSFRSAR